LVALYFAVREPDPARRLADELAERGYRTDTLFPELGYVARRIIEEERARFKDWHHAWRRGEADEP
jgi:uncharacterized protein YbgA (DUF1722 family)